jgi:hypothetical protein
MAKFQFIIQFDTLKAALDYQFNSTLKFDSLLKCYNKYYLYNYDNDEIKDLTYLINKDIKS